MIYNKCLLISLRVSLTEIPIFLARVESVIFAKGLSAPQHSTYFVILLEGRDLEGTPGVAKNVTLFIERDDVKEKR